MWRRCRSSWPLPQSLHHDLRLLNPRFDSPLLDVLTDLEHLRRLELRGSTPPPVFLQLKSVFHLLECLASARIEGNHTTLADFVEAKLAPAAEPTDALRELINIEAAMAQVEAAVEPGAPLPEALLRGLHATAVQALQREGDRTPGQYRAGPVQIAGATHQRPAALEVPRYMAELVAFINEPHPPKYDLMKVALAHHRFAWVHPFGNGNGRVAGDLEAALPGMNANQRTYQVRKLLDAGMLQPVRPGARQYTLGFTHNRLLRGVVKTLTDQGFVPPALAGLAARGDASGPVMVQ